MLLAPEVEAVLSSEIAGRINFIGAQDGDAVEQGQTLVRFDCAVQKAELAKAQAELDGAVQTYESNRKLSTLGSFSELDLAVSKSKMAQARAEVSRMRALTAMCSIQAPFAGRVVEVRVNNHESVPEGQPLVELLDHRNLEAELFAPSGWLRWLETGQPLELLIGETGGRYPAVVHNIGARVDPVSQTIPLRVRIQGDHPELLPGMSGLAEFPALEDE